ncbi:hypothetical protein KOW79_007575 [Hemibagrus wyckioides]|uniref:Uncharacterized protein n=1 Tax=Hemibagrus wyckioides TaxID=337641 RepID=A0A9D3NVP9_9TELE|nr:hypothetical protein KOW79_007575 [Hemibagrus wyckioides]
MARPLWQAVSVAKCILWGARCEGIRSLSRRVSQARLFRLFRAKLRKVQGEEQGGEGFVRVGVGVLEGGGFSGTTVLGAPWWPDRAREKGEEAVFTEGAAEPAASSGPVSEEVAGPSGKEVRIQQVSRAGYGGGRQTLRVWSYHRGGGGDGGEKNKEVTSGERTGV